MGAFHPQFHIPFLFFWRCHGDERMPLSVREGRAVGFHQQIQTSK